MTNETVPTKFCTDASFNHLIEVKNNGVALLTIHNDGTITAAEHLKPTETAAEVLRIMRETWMADAQSIKIRELRERIKRLEEDLMDAKNKHAALVADVVLYEDRGERIKRLESVENSHAAVLNAIDNWIRQYKAMEAKP
jgi:hypothetical protein